MSTMSTKGGWVEVYDANGLPRWATRAFVRDDGEVFFPEPKEQVVLCALFDGVDMVTADGHCYVPMTWLKSHDPDDANRLRRIETKIRRTRLNN